MQKIFHAMFILFAISMEAQTSENEKEIRLKINTTFQNNHQKCILQIKDAVTDNNGKIEFWKLCDLENGNRIIQIESHAAETFYQETYFEENGQLVYAKETENYMPLNSFTLIPWNCKFYFENGKLATYISNISKTDSVSYSLKLFSYFKDKFSIHVFTFVFASLFLRIYCSNSSKDHS